MIQGQMGVQRNARSNSQNQYQKQRLDKFEGSKTDYNIGNQIAQLGLGSRREKNMRNDYEKQVNHHQVLRSISKDKIQLCNPKKYTDHLTTFNNHNISTNIVGVSTKMNVAPSIPSVNHFDRFGNGLDRPRSRSNGYSKPQYSKTYSYGFLGANNHVASTYDTVSINH